VKELLLTLGHNSSAILIEDGELKWGYETERHTGLKSDSRNPMEHLPPAMQARPDVIYATHWSPDGNLSSMSKKHWDPYLVDGVPIRTLSVDRTHHDTHIFGAMAYAGEWFCSQANTYGLVIDGFGTFGEHLSVYRFDGGSPTLVKRVHGYGTSLGLWYQYATAYMGMKMHEDEYKLLGYEVHVKDAVADRLDKLASAKGYDWLVQMDKSIYGSKYDPLYSLTALENVRTNIFQHLNEVCKMVGVDDPTSFESRCTIAYYVQAVLENVVLEIVKAYKPDNILLSGGVFYNVKLNKRIIDTVLGKTCIYPLAGDQGNAIGLYRMDHPEFKFPDTLNWGVRKLTPVGRVEGMYVMHNEAAATAVLIDIIAKHGYCNIVRGSMEFGPRAMCNTSTLAMPHKSVVEKINAANGRNTVMPMAPVMKRWMYEQLFQHTDRLHRSEEHMITALEFNPVELDDMTGAAHFYRRPYVHHTGRPQVCRPEDKLLNDVLDNFGHPLINTSFNFHGHPIAFNMESVVKNHQLQRGNDKNYHTVVLATNAK
jgi:carbamoyltransferase